MAGVGLLTVQKVGLDLGWPGFELWLCQLESELLRSQSLFSVVGMVTGSGVLRNQ